MLLIADKKNPKLKELKDIMVQYAKMDSELHQFLEAVDHVKGEVWFPVSK